MKPKLQIIVGSTRQNRFSEKPAHWLYEQAKKITDIDVEIVDLRDYPMPYFDEPMSPKYSKGKYPNKNVEKWAKKIAEADGYIIVTAEYNHGYAAVLKNALDYVYYEWNKKPVAFVSYGTVGGARGVEQLRQVVIELEMVPVKYAMHIPMSTYMSIVRPQDADPEGEIKNPLDSMTDQAQIMLEQTVWWAKVLKSARSNKE